MDMHACTGSTRVAAFGYEPRTQDFAVRFHVGGTYQYRRVPYAVFEAFLKAPSKGRFIDQHIKGKFDYERI